MKAQELKKLVYATSQKLGCTELEVIFQYYLTFEGQERSRFKAEESFAKLERYQYIDAGGLEEFCIRKLR